MKLPLIVISPEQTIVNEINYVIDMFKNGLHQFHLRKPFFSKSDIDSYLSNIPKQYLRNVVIHSHFSLTEKYRLKGIHVGEKRVNESKPFINKVEYVGYSAHSTNEILENRNSYTHFFLSPVYNSISKIDYKANINLRRVQNFVYKHGFNNIIALGGITAFNANKTLSYGFTAVATIGEIWQTNKPVEQFLKLKKQVQQRVYALSVAGFDPCSGAGVTTDVKTFEQFKVQGLGVTTAITYQNDSEFEALDWLSFDQIKKQLDLQFKKYPIKFVKIGLINSFEILDKLVNYLKQKNEKIQIVWDPILKASAGFEFHKVEDRKKLFEVLKQIYLITPNSEECKLLFGVEERFKLDELMEENDLNNILITGGHNEDEKGNDYLYHSEGNDLFWGEAIAEEGKHGTGCVLSSAICAGLAKGNNITDSVANAKRYVEKFIDSNSGNLGYHNV